MALIINGYDVDADAAAALKRIHAGIDAWYLREMRNIAEQKALRRHDRMHPRSAGQFFRHLKRLHPL